MKLSLVVVACFFCQAAAWGQSFVVHLQPETTKAFDSYVIGVEEKLDDAIRTRAVLQDISRNKKLQAQILEGGVFVERIKTPKIPKGIIHDWVGTALIRGVLVEDVASLLKDYDGHSKLYPEVVDSRIVSESDGRMRAFLKLRKKKILTVVLNTEYDVVFEEMEKSLWVSRSRSVRISEVYGPDSPQERELPVGEDRGFLWRLNAYWQLSQVEDGVVVQCRAVSLSRKIPTGLGWLVRPIVAKMPRKSLEETLVATRNALQH